MAEEPGWDAWQAYALWCELNACDHCGGEGEDDDVACLYCGGSGIHPGADYVGEPPI